MIFLQDTKFEGKTNIYLFE